jgi:pyruvate carboxylase
VDEEGRLRVFFELNGEPRATRIVKAGLGDQVRARRKVEEGNPRQVGAPMPGSVVTVAVKPGQKVVRGAPLLSIEAMKMETVLSAEIDGVIKAVHVKSGELIGVKDLLVEYA